MSRLSEKRKRDHLVLCAEDRVRFQTKTTLLEQVGLIHRALPELGLDDIHLSTTFLGKSLLAPLWISAMTGGTDGASRFNLDMAGVAEELGLGFCLGSMRPMLEDPSRRPDFDVRTAAPTALVMGNVGVTELIRRGHQPILVALDQIGADGLTVHLNPAMELFQPGGDRDFKGAIDAIARLIENHPDLPVVVKETGCGLSFQDGTHLAKIGVKRVEIGGAGGTSWVGVETLRTTGAKARLGEMLWDWGIPTAVSTAWLVDQGFEVVAAGGVRTGLDVARALALGAGLCGLAAPVVQAYHLDGLTGVKALLSEILDGLRCVMLLCGVRRPSEMARVPRVLGSTLDQWIGIGQGDK
jgi:isopentenyl-diphosphate delta-isomerase